MEEVLKLVSFSKDNKDQWCVKEVNGDVFGNVLGNVRGDVRGNVEGFVEGSVGGSEVTTPFRRMKLWVEQGNVGMSDDLAEYVVKNIMENFPEASAGSSLRCIGWHYDQWEFIFEDDEGTKYTLDQEKLMSAFPLLFTEKWKNYTPVPTYLLHNKEHCDNWLCQADAFDFDAFVQLAVFGEVIYG